MATTYVGCWFNDVCCVIFTADGPLAVNQFWLEQSKQTSYFNILTFFFLSSGKVRTKSQVLVGGSAFTNMKPFQVDSWANRCLLTPASLITMVTVAFPCRMFSVQMFFSIGSILCFSVLIWVRLPPSPLQVSFIINIILNIAGVWLL